MNPKDNGGSNGSFTGFNLPLKCPSCGEELAEGSLGLMEEGPVWIAFHDRDGCCAVLGVGIASPEMQALLQRM